MVNSAGVEGKEGRMHPDYISHFKTLESCVLVKKNHKNLFAFMYNNTDS